MNTNIAMPPAALQSGAEKKATAAAEAIKGEAELAAEPVAAAAEDVWNVTFEDDADRLHWADKKAAQRAFTVLLGVLRGVAVLALLYIFIIGLDLLGSAFQIVGGTTAGRAFRNSDLFHNPIAGLVIGILATVLVQSSSTSTSIIITMTASNLLTVDQAVPMIMGANIGTSVTNTIVSMGQISDRNQFRRAFAGATVHDMFNFLSVLVLLPIEYFTHYLRHISELTVNSMNVTTGSEEMNFLKVLTKPVTDRIISVNRSLITSIGIESDPAKLEELYTQSMVRWSNCAKPDKWFIYCAVDSWSDVAVGATLLIFALALIIFALVFIVKVLQSALKGSMAVALRKALNMEFPGPFAFLSDYMLVVVGAVITILVQSSSITTSTLTPLVGMGVLRLEKMYPVTLGANVGTTVTGIMAALASSNLYTALVISFCHVYFNVSGILLWFVIPVMRKVPIALARSMGDITAKHRWFAAFYIITAFLLVPLALFGLSLAGPVVMLAVLVPIIVVVTFFAVVFALRAHKPDVLPACLREFYWLPLWMRREPRWLAAYHEKLELKAALKDAEEQERRAREGKKLGLTDRIMYSLGSGGNPQKESTVDMA